MRHTFDQSSLFTLCTQIIKIIYPFASQKSLMGYIFKGETSFRSDGVPVIRDIISRILSCMQTGYRKSSIQFPGGKQCASRDWSNSKPLFKQ